jgi:UDP-2,3-diacylglucosamine pyrophosphatase LpxH
MIIVTDAHVSKARGNDTAFFHMLAAIENTEHDLIFLGDIFDLCIALPRYETEIHHHFTSWCREQKKNRTIGFLEGNHEFYLASHRAEAFTWCSNDAWWQDEAGTVYVHGDQINRRDTNYLRFRKLGKNRISRYILRWLPFGPNIADSLKKGLKNTNMQSRLQIPWDEIKSFADNRFAEGVDTIFVGHFHREYGYGNQESKKMYLLPDWLGTQKVSLFQKNPLKISTRPWRELL